MTILAEKTVLSTNEQPIVIIGAGVLGLTTALTLQKRYPHLAEKITIIAAELPSLPVSWTSNSTIDATGERTTKSPSTTNGNGTSNGTDPSGSIEQQVSTPSADYASMWAGAHYRPIPRSTRQLEEEFELAIKTSEIMNQIAREYAEGVCGVAVMSAVELLETIPEGTEKAVAALKNGDVYAGTGDEFRVLTKEELKAYDVEDRLTWGCKYVSYCVNVHLFCCWLVERFKKSGGIVVKRRLKDLEEVFELNEDEGVWNRDGEDVGMRSRIVINTTGRNFDVDPKVKIIRGQTVLVKNEYRTTITRQMTDGSWSFLIPRPGGGGTVVGGTKEIGDAELKARPETRKILLENAAKCFPDFVESVDDFKVVMDNVGRRPWREGGLRIEAEDISVSDNDRRVVLHGYGAGGRGYELSWGVAEKIVNLFDNHTQQSKALH